MTLAHFWPWQSWALLGLNLAAEFAVLWLAIQRKFFNKMVMLPVFAGFCVVFDLGTIIMGCTLHVDAVNGQMWFSHPYWLFYWAGQIIAAVIVLLLAVQVVIMILPPWDSLITLIGILAVLAVAIVYAKMLPVQGPHDVLKVLSLASAITILTLPIIWVVKSTDWPKGVSLIVAGLVLSLLLQVGCTITAAFLKTMAGFVSYGVPCAALVGMSFYLAALLKIDTSEMSAA